jgi:hypothetical protein
MNFSILKMCRSGQLSGGPYAHDSAPDGGKGDLACTPQFLGTIFGFFG